MSLLRSLVLVLSNVLIYKFHSQSNCEMTTKWTFQNILYSFYNFSEVFFFLIVFICGFLILSVCHNYNNFSTDNSYCVDFVPFCFEHICNFKILFNILYLSLYSLLSWQKSVYEVPEKYFVNKAIWSILCAHLWESNIWKRTCNPWV